MSDTGLSHALGVSHGDQIVRHRAHVLSIEPAAVDARALIDRKLEVNAGDRGDRPRCAEEMRARSRDFRAEAMLRLEAFDGCHHVGHHRLVAFTRHLAPTMTLGEIDHADRQRGPGGDAVLHVDPVMQIAAVGMPKLGEVEPDQLRAAAADIEHERPVAIAVDQRGATRDSELRLGFLRHDLDFEPRLATHALDELTAVGGDAAGFGCDQSRARHLAAMHLVGADLERFDGARHRRL